MLFPACAGVILPFSCVPFLPGTFPRVCGGDPAILDILDRMGIFSPRVRG